MKLELGRQWQAQAGPNYRYFIVFKNKDFNIGGAYRLDEFTEIMKELYHDHKIRIMVDASVEPEALALNNPVPPPDIAQPYNNVDQVPLLLIHGL